MQAHRLPVLAGLQWIQMGWVLFRSQPAVLYTWTMLISLGLILAMLTAPIGPLFFVVLVPTVTFLTLSACRRAHEGERLLLSRWLEPLKASKGLFPKLLKLGVVYAAISLAAALVSFLPFTAELTQALQGLEDDSDMALLAQALRTPVMIFTILYFILAALFWYAPVLIGWHNLTVTRSLFYSAVACWRNKWSLMLYGLVWAAIFTVMDWVFFALAGVVMPSIAAALQVPVNLLVVCVLYCSFYPTYITVFRSIRERTEPPAPLL